MHLFFQVGNKRKRNVHDGPRLCTSAKSPQTKFRFDPCPDVWNFIVALQQVGSVKHHLLPAFHSEHLAATSLAPLALNASANKAASRGHNPWTP